MRFCVAIAAKEYDRTRRFKATKPATLRGLWITNSSMMSFCQCFAGRVKRRYGCLVAPGEPGI
jgi:hypothetical protein